MPQTPYTFSIGTSDFAAGVTQVILRDLKSNINADATIIAATRSCDYIKRLTNNVTNNVTILMDDALSSPAQTDALAAVVLAYEYVAPSFDPVDNLTAKRTPDFNDDNTKGYSEGSHWLDRTNNKYYVCTSSLAGNAYWTRINVRYQKAVVDAAGGGDYTHIADAFAAGATSVFVRNGTYVETVDIVVPNGGQLIGETMGSVVVALVAGNSIIMDATGGFMENVGSIAVVHNSNTVTGTATTFTNLSPGHFIMVHENYIQVASIESATSLTLADTYQGKTIAGSPYRAHPMYLGVRLNNLIVAMSTDKGIFIRGCRNSTVYGVACKGNTPNIHIQHCANVGVVNGASEMSNGDGILVDESVSVLIDTMGISNCTGSGISIVNAASGVIIDGSTSNSNNGHGISMSASSEFVNINDTVLRNNTQKGLFSDATTSSVVVVNCNVCENGGDGIDMLGEHSSIGNCLVMYNEAQGVNVGNLSVVSNNHIKGNTNDGLNLVTSNNCIVIGNIFDGNGGDGVEIDGNNNLCTSNRSQNNSGWGINIAVGSTRNTLGLNDESTNNTLGCTQDLGTGTRFTVNVTHHTRDPIATDDVSLHFTLGHIWLNTSDDSMFACLNNAANAAKWVGGFGTPPASLSVASTNAEGTALTSARSDHSHAISLDVGQFSSATPTATFTVSSSTLTAGNLVVDRVLVVDATAGAITLTSPAAASLVAAIPAGAAVVGMAWHCYVVHTAPDTNDVTVAAGAGTTLVGSAAVSSASPGCAQLLLRLDNVTPLSEAVTIVRIA